MSWVVNTSVDLWKVSLLAPKALVCKSSGNSCLTVGLSAGGSF